MVSETETWFDEGVPFGNMLSVTPYKDSGERSVIFGTEGTKRPAPALNETQVRELVDWLNAWLAEGE